MCKQWFDPNKRQYAYDVRWCAIFFLLEVVFDRIYLAQNIFADMNEQLWNKFEKKMSNDSIELWAVGDGVDGETKPKKKQFFLTKIEQKKWLSREHRNV